MNWMLPFSVEPQPLINSYHQRLLLLGSCFADEIGKKLTEHKFHATANPFGTLFSPFAIAEMLEQLCLSTPNYFLYQRNDVWLSWQHSSLVYANTEQDLKHQINELHKQTQSLVNKHKPTIFITFGTAHVYHHQTENIIVANCHKAPGNLFKKQLLSTDQIVERYTAILSNPIFQSCTFVFSVSPVRYSKEGLVENNLSKAILIQAVHQLVDTFEQAYYLPAYELVNDVLRDYRFFKDDLVHPNHLAVNEVWKLFGEIFCNQDVQQYITKQEQLIRMQQHHLLFPESVEGIKFIENKSRYEAELRADFHLANWA